MSESSPVYRLPASAPDRIARLVDRIERDLPLAAADKRLVLELIKEAQAVLVCLKVSELRDQGLHWRDCYEQAAEAMHTSESTVRRIYARLRHRLDKDRKGGVTR